MIEKNRRRTLTVISLGAGVQSSTMAIMAAKGDLPPVDVAIFADTGNEPKAVYTYLNYLSNILPFPIFKVRKGNIKDDMLNAKGKTNFVVAPFFTQNKITGKKGMVMRQCTNDYKIQVSRALQAAGVTGGFDSETGQELAPPDALVSWIANKWVSGQWTESYTSEQLALFADPFRSGVRDTDFTNYVTTAGVEGLERTAEKEDRIKQLYTQYLGPVFGKLTDTELSQKAGRLRNDPDYEASLIDQLKNNRLALFPKYTNPELSYEDIVTPWRNLTTSILGEAADETQSWWQDMVATNDFTTGSATLRTKGLEMGNNQVTIEATEALQRALGDGSVLQNLGANQ